MYIVQVFVRFGKNIRACLVSPWIFWHDQLDPLIFSRIEQKPARLHVRTIKLDKVYLTSGSRVGRETFHTYWAVDIRVQTAQYFVLHRKHSSLDG